VGASSLGGGGGRWSGGYWGVAGESVGGCDAGGGFRGLVLRVGWWGGGVGRPGWGQGQGGGGGVLFVGGGGGGAVGRGG